MYPNLSALNLNLSVLISRSAFLHDTLQTGIVCDMIMGEGKSLTFLQKIKSVQNEVFVYYFEGKFYECLENKLCPQMIEQIFII